MRMQSASNDNGIGQTYNAGYAHELYRRACLIDESTDTYDAAVMLYTEAIRLDPSHARAYVNLGNVRYRQGRIEEAAGLYSRALDIDASVHEASYNLGYLEIEAGRYTQALRYLHRALAHLCGGEATNTYFLLGQVYNYLGARDFAAYMFLRYLTLAPEGEFRQEAYDGIGSS